MDGACLKAVAHLKRIGARNVPSPYIVEAAADGSQWRGKTGMGVSWSLRKHGRERYEYHPVESDVPSEYAHPSSPLPHGRSAV